MIKTRWKIAIAIAISALIIVCITGYATVQISKDILKNRGSDFMMEVVNRAVGELNQQILNVMGNKNTLEQQVLTTYDVEAATHNPNYTNEYLDQIAPTVRLVAEFNPAKSAYVYLVDPKNPSIPLGSIWYSDLNKDGVPEKQMNLPLTSVTMEHLYRQARYNTPLYEKKPVWASPFPEKLGNDKAATFVSYSGPVQIGGKVVAVVGADMYYDDLTARLRQIQYFESGYLFLVDSNMRFLYHPDEKAGTKLSGIDHGYFKDLSDQMKTYTSGNQVHSNTMGIEQRFVYKKLHNDWILTMVTNESEFAKGLDAIYNLLAIVIGISIVVSFVLAFYFGRSIGRPFEYITNQITQIGLGNYDIEMEEAFLKRSDESGVLIRAVDQMKERQKVSFSEISRYNNELEAMVRIRTEELNKTNEYLELSLAQTEEQQAMLLETNGKLEESIETINRTQKQLLESEKIASLSYVVSGIAHEINTPVGNCITATSYLENELNQLSEHFEGGSMKRSTMKSFIDNAKESCSHLLRNLETSKQLVENFKELAVNKTSSQSAEINVAQFVGLVVDSVKTAHPERLREFKLQCHPDLTLICEPLKFVQLLTELVENSFIHGFEGRQDGLIEVIAEYSEDKTYLNILYRDNGAGIPIELRKDVFTPFFSTKFGTGHRGLGLNVVYNLIKGTFAGEIEINEDHQQGVEFKIKLSSESA